ncbi:sialate O-acetylesterase [Flavitalea flava]
MMQVAQIKKYTAAGLLVILVCLNVQARPLYGSIFNKGLSPGFSVAATIQSKMVIQQDRPFILWGKGSAGTEIKIRADWMRTPQQVICGEGNEWKTAINVPKAEKGKYVPHTITLISSRDTLALSDILIGEVWICGGQSNMDMTIKPFLPWLKGALDFEKEIEAADYPAIRLFDVRTDFTATPQDDCQGFWKICSPATAGDFSAAAYFFARELYNKLHVPIGLVVSSVGGSSCQAWASRETLAADPALNQKYLYPYDTSLRSREKLDSVVTFEKVVRPTLFYNAMIYPLRNLSVCGFIWYQGESNKDDKAMYTRLCGAMIRNWRTLFGRAGVGFGKAVPDLPFYYVQVAPYTWEKNDSTAWNYATLREAQGAIRDSVKNTGMVVITDISEPDDIHPRNKQGVGLRLAKNALARTYGQKNTPYLGPRFAKMQIDGELVKIFFFGVTTGSGLTTSDGAAPKNFYISGPDHIFYYAEAWIVNNQVWLRSDKVKEPVAVRYAFTNYPVTNFGNKEGLPAEPFRSDNWE